jgi:hypothetical protein
MSNAALCDSTAFTEMWTSTVRKAGSIVISLARGCHPDFKIKSRMSSTNCTAVDTRRPANCASCHIIHQSRQQRRAI